MRYTMVLFKGTQGYVGCMMLVYGRLVFSPFFVKDLLLNLFI